MFSEVTRAMEAAPVDGPTGVPLCAAGASVRAHYRLEAVADFIVRRKATRVALQFPDHLLPDTTRIVADLHALLAAAPDHPPTSLFVLSDNTFGACCPDEVTAAHYTAECIVHFGYACMSKATRLDVMYVPQRGAFDGAAVVETLRPLLADDAACHVVVVLSAPARHVRAAVHAALAAVDPVAAGRVIVADRPVVEGSSSEWVIAGDALPRCQAGDPPQHLVFVGADDSPALLQLGLVSRYNASIDVGGTVHLVLPTDAPRAATAQRVLRAVDQRLQRRMYNIEVIKSASAVGILVCTLAIARYRESAELLAKVLRRSGRRCYTIYIGHLNEFKVANFVDSIDAFCVISCPHSRVAQFPCKDDNMLKPLCSPVEVLIALGYLAFEDPEAYTTDFAACCSQAKQLLDSGKGPQAGVDGAADGACASSSALVNSGGGAVQRLAERLYRGLDARLGETPVQATLHEGRVGIARGYVQERVSQAGGTQLCEQVEEES